jgi:hypothetical protein
LFKDVDLRDIGDSNFLEDINGQTFINLISSGA